MDYIIPIFLSLFVIGLMMVLFLFGNGIIKFPESQEIQSPTTQIEKILTEFEELSHQKKIELKNKIDPFIDWILE